MRINLRMKIFTSFLAVVILTGIVSAAGILGMQSIQNSYDTIIDQNMAIVNCVRRIETGFAGQAAALRAYMLFKNDNYTLEYNTVKNEITETFTELESYSLSQKSSEYMQTVKNIQEEYTELSEQIIKLVRSNNTTTLPALTTKIRLLDENIKEMTSGWIEIEEQESVLVRQKAESAHNLSNYVSIATTAAAIVLSIIIGTILSINIARPIKSLTVSSEAIAKGDLTQPFKKIKNRDEIKALASTFEKMQSNLKELLVKISQASQALSSSSQQLTATSQETSASSTEVATTINQLAEGASNQARELESASRIVSGMANYIGEVSKNSESATELSKTVMEISEKGIEISNDTISKIEDIKISTNHTAELIRILEEKSVKIGDIIDVIKGVADQTNLLALNAAIEAARAGDMGKGFAVVADEVRILAEQSSESADQISQLIADIQAQTQNAADSMNTNVRNVEVGVNSVISTGEAFKSITMEIQKVVDEIIVINKGVQEIADGGKDISKSMENIAAVAEQTAASSEEVSATTEEQTAAMQEVAASAQDLSRLAEELQETVSKFKF